MRRKGFANAKQRKGYFGTRLYGIHKVKLPVTVDAGDHLRGSSVKKYDKRVKALKPGKRISAHKKVYYEYRRNHADLHPRTKL
jgi:hypothetical protein